MTDDQYSAFKLPKIKCINSCLICMIFHGNLYVKPFSEENLIKKIRKKLILHFFGEHFFQVCVSY